MDYKQLLIDTLSVQTSSGKEEKMIAYIKEFVTKNVPSAKVEVKDNNVYVTKGVAEYYPCVVAHTDTVHDMYQDFGVYERDDVLFAFSSDTETQVGIGGDDKVGVWIGLAMLLVKDAIKCAFFHSEEIGCVGSSAADMDFFSNVGYVFQSDRRGCKDFVTNIYSTDLSSKDFQDTIQQTINSRGYNFSNGGLTDVYQLKENGLDVCVANMSSGYYSPHSDKEVVCISDAVNCMSMISELIDLLGENLYSHKAESRYDMYGGYDWGYNAYGYGHRWGGGKKKRKKKKRGALGDTYQKTGKTLGTSAIWNSGRYVEKSDSIDGVITKDGVCDYCNNNVYKGDTIDNDYAYCYGCDMIIDKSQYTKI